MRIAYISEFYHDYLEKRWANMPLLSTMSYDQILFELNQDAFAWADHWVHAIRKLGHESTQIVANALPLQRRWALENLVGKDLKSLSLTEIVVEQIRYYRPDVIWLNSHTVPLIKAVREHVGKNTPIIGWVGSAVPNIDWSLFNGVLSCAHESVDRLRTMGIRAEQMHHVFAPTVLETLPKSIHKSDQIVFCGQLNPAAQFHTGREQFLRDLSETVPIKIYAFVPNIMSRPRRYLNRLLNRPTSTPLPRFGSKADTHGPIFGLEMYKKTAESLATLNIHADSSPIHASNVRMFETTGVGAPLITDWRENIPTLFTPDEEVITYRSLEECQEKIRWVLDNPAQAKKIGEAGQARCLRDHTFDVRAKQLLHHFSEFRK